VKALVTGGAGFIGSHIVDALLNRGHEVRILDNLESRVHPQGAPPYLNPHAEFIKGDVRDRGALEYALTGMDVVLHQAGHQDYMPDYAKMFHSNAVATALLFEIIQAKSLPVQKVLIASATAIYGEGQYCCSDHGLILPEPRTREQLDRGDWDVRCPECNAVLVPALLREPHFNPASPFGVSKLAEEMAALRLGAILGIPVVILRYSIVQGALQSCNGYSGICLTFVSAFRNGQPPMVFEDGLQLRDYVHVSDVVAANMIALEDSRADGQAFNVGSGRATSVLDYARQLGNRMGSAVTPSIAGLYRVGDVRHAISSIVKLEALGWKPTKHLREIFDDYLAWIDANPDQSDYITPALDVMKRAGVIRSVAHAKGVSAGN
jgi:dTDP-L-rhamnose 4-epimerase